MAKQSNPTPSTKITTERTQIEKINKPESWLFEKITQILNLLS
jgi:hypothetical protein